MPSPIEVVRAKKLLPGVKEHIAELQRERRRADPEKTAARAKKWNDENPDKRKQMMDDWRKSNPERWKAGQRGIQMLRRYGLTQETYALKFEAQGFACAICLTSSTAGRNWHVDHNHKTGATRGILCHHCNVMLGNAGDDIERLKAAISYLEAHDG